MSKANLMKDGDEVLTGRDGIIIRKHIYGLEGGRVLDTDALKSGNDTIAPAYTAEVIPCGIPVIFKRTEGVASFRALPPLDIATTEGGTTTTTYKFDLPDGWAYIGIAAATVKAGSPCPVMTNGVVNETAMLDYLQEIFPSAMETPTALSLSGLKTACPHLEFMSDEKIA